MKKILGISLVAVLAATPLMANAAEGDQVAKIQYGTVTASPNIATTSYVQGAYKAAADQIDAVIDSTSIATNGNYIDAGKSVAHNLGELDAAAKANADAIGILNGTGNGSVDKKIEDAIAEVNTAASNLEDRVEANETAIGVINGQGQGSIAYAVAAEESRATTAEGTLTNLTTDAKTNLVAAINEVDSHADANATAISNETTRATTAEGVLTTAVATINNKQIPVVSDWTTGAVTQTKISELVTYVAPANDG